MLSHLEGDKGFIVSFEFMSFHWWDGLNDHFESLPIRKVNEETSKVFDRDKDPYQLHMYFLKITDSKKESEFQFMLPIICQFVFSNIII